ncbi:glycosyl transferase [Salinimicrobium marinum]|uniref:Glycosyl transferase n=1 Tax=Salinimicrobium marinum TaxID=680283 RepID=A0A918SLS6_9FLAO|nr:glycosyltransferase family 2 protein [Salinimicrobium marinum]GHA49338.1 glycosyl transferase [Salinimicrobium marinum]
MGLLVSIIIPTYNRAHLISGTLDSVMAQSYQNWECIVVDDGSTDTTKELLERYCKRDKRFRYLLRPKNRPKGANACRNYGLEMSKGAYVNWFDSDDIMLKSKLQYQVEALENNISYFFCLCQTEVIDTISGRSKGLRAAQIFSDSAFNDYIRREIFWLTGAPLWKREFIDKNHLRFDEKLQQSQDYDFHISILAICDSYIPLEAVLVQLQLHDGNMSNSIIDSSQKFLSNIEVRVRTLHKYTAQLDEETKAFLFNDIFSFFKLSISTQNLSTRLKSWFMVVRSLKYFNIPVQSKLKESSKWLFGAISSKRYYLTSLILLPND